MFVNLFINKLSPSLSLDLTIKRAKLKYNNVFINMLVNIILNLNIYIYIYICGAREFVIPVHFSLGPKAHAEERCYRGHATKVQMAQRYSRGRSCPRRPKTQKEGTARHQRRPPELSQKKGRVYCRSSSRKTVTSALNVPTNVLTTLMEKGSLNSAATKNKGKTVITAIKYSVPDRAMLFSFYNHPQPLLVWTDKTSTNPIKLSLHVDVRGKGKASIKEK